MPLRLSVLDQSPVPSGSTPADALQNSISLARHVDALGYTRLWYSEHHAMALLACTAPEVLLARIGVETQRIRIGSGGIMLPHYSPYKVAEVFNTLATLYPGRIDLGVGRAPGGGQLESHALRRVRTGISPDDFPNQLAELLAFLHPEHFPHNHPFANLLVSPAPPANLATEPAPLLTSNLGTSAKTSEPSTLNPGPSPEPGAPTVTPPSSRVSSHDANTTTPPPEPRALSPEPSPSSAPDVWLLGSSMWSSTTAAAEGLPYSYAHFFSPQLTHAAIEHYRANFKPSDYRRAPEASIALGVICADTQPEADRLHQTVKLLQRRIRMNDRRPLETPEEAARYLAALPQPPNPLIAFTAGPLDEPESEFPRYIVGTPETVRTRLLAIAHELELNEIIINTITHDHQARLHSYSLLAKAFELS